MRVVDRKTFLALPEGTIYCKGTRWVFGGLSVKHETIGNDWYYLDRAWPDAADSGAAFAALEHSLAEGRSFPCEDAVGRDGCFEDNAVFLIFERDDLGALASDIAAALRACT